MRIFAFVSSFALCTWFSAVAIAEPEPTPNDPDPAIGVLDLGTETVDLAPGGGITTSDAGTGFVPGAGGFVGGGGGAPNPAVEAATTPVVQTGCSYAPGSSFPPSGLVLAFAAGMMLLWSRRRSDF